MIKTYAMLTKPGIIMGNLITTTAGFALAARGVFHPLLFLITVIGLGLVIASACVCNSYIDRLSDRKMARTRTRPLATGRISIRSALVFAAFMGVAGIAILAFYTNLVATGVALSGFVIYVFLYSLLKHHTRYATLIGSISGAVPPVAGYAAAGGTFDLGALLLFLLLVFWQMPHFYAIAIYRFADYKAASIPVMPIVKGVERTHIHMLLYITAFFITALLLYELGFASLAYYHAASITGFGWLILCLQGFRSTPTQDRKSV